MITLSDHQIDTALGVVGKHTKQGSWSTVSTDSRTIPAGALFFALQGKNFDGNQFIEQAITKGAQGIVSTLSQIADYGVPCWQVEDTTIALGQLAAYVRQQCDLPIVAITGSAGKTTTKEMIFTILSQLGLVLKTEGNFNNHIGVPKTLLALTQQHQFAVVELGANHPQEIDYCVQLVQPQVALITNASAAHLAGFGSIAGVVQAKGEIYHHLEKNDIAIVNQDSPHADIWLNKIQGKKLTFSQHTTADIRVENIQMNSQGYAEFTVYYQQQQQQIALSLSGMHQVENALAAISACLALQIPFPLIASGLTKLQPIAGRLVRQQLTQRLWIIDDTYNASVNSVYAAIDHLAIQPQEHKILILGDLGELGEKAEIYHQQLGIYAEQQQITHLFTLGTLSRYSQNAYSKQGSHHQQLEILLINLMELLTTTTTTATVLVKGSRAMQMNRVINFLITEFKDNDRC